MSFRPIYEGWDLPGRLSRKVRKTFAGIGLNRDARGADKLAHIIWQKIEAANLDTDDGRADLAASISQLALAHSPTTDPDSRFLSSLQEIMSTTIEVEGWFAVPNLEAARDFTRSELWELEDQLKRTEAIIDNIDDVQELSAAFLGAISEPLLAQYPQLTHGRTTESGELIFAVGLRECVKDLPEVVEHIMQVPFAPDFEPLLLMPRLRERLEYNLHLASGGVPGDPSSARAPKLPTRNTSISSEKLPETYLGGTPLLDVFDQRLYVAVPQSIRFEHQHIVAGSGHGKTQTLQHLILHDLKAVERGEASIIVIDSQSDLINNIAGLDLFAPGNSLAERLVLIDPTDIEWPVALNLFDVGLDRLDEYSPLDRERLTNSILELYDFVLGSLLDAGMTQKQTVIFRYITRLLLHIPNATIHTLRELLEDGGSERYREQIRSLQGSARSFFEHEFDGKEFANTKRQVLRRLYGILENQTFERMFSHPKSKLDLFSEMSAGKVILINTAKDLLKENGTEIFGRFFIAMIAQAAQERAVLESGKRLPTFVYVDEANDYFDRNIGIILSQARKYNVGMVLAHQFLGQLDTKLHEAIAANTSIKFAGGVSAKDARALANDLRTEPGFIEKQFKLSFAAFIKGQTDRAVSLKIEPGQLERMPRLTEGEKEALRDEMRRRYAVHYTELNLHADSDDDDDRQTDTEDGPETPDDGEPMPWGDR